MIINNIHSLVLALEIRDQLTSIKNNCYAILGFFYDEISLERLKNGIEYKIDWKKLQSLTKEETIEVSHHAIESSELSADQSTHSKDAAAKSVDDFYNDPKFQLETDIIKDLKRDLDYWKDLLPSDLMYFDKNERPNLPNLARNIDSCLSIIDKICSALDSLDA